jgi:hypothetical protein
MLILSSIITSSFSHSILWLFLVCSIVVLHLPIVTKKAIASIANPLNTLSTKNYSLTTTRISTNHNAYTLKVLTQAWNYFIYRHIKVI